MPSVYVCLCVCVHMHPEVSNAIGKEMGQNLTAPWASLDQCHCHTRVVRNAGPRSLDQNPARAPCDSWHMMLRKHGVEGASVT